MRFLIISQICVKYIDFGNQEVVPWKEVRVMQKRFMRCPEFSLRCSLHDIGPVANQQNEGWPHKATETFLMMTEEKV